MASDDLPTNGARAQTAAGALPFHARAMRRYMRVCLGASSCLRVACPIHCSIRVSSPALLGGRAPLITGAIHPPVPRPPGRTLLLADLATTGQALPIALRNGLGAPLMFWSSAQPGPWGMDKANTNGPFPLFGEAPALRAPDAAQCARAVCEHHQDNERLAVLCFSLTNDPPGRALGCRREGQARCRSYGTSSPPHHQRGPLS